MWRRYKAILFLHFAFVSSIQGQFGPSVVFNNGKYWGENYFNADLGIHIPHGRGTYVSDDTSVKFDGFWEHGEILNGTRYFPNDRNYTGQFQNVMFHGKGQLDYQNGTSIIGDFRNGVPCGNVVVEYSNGDIRRGYFDGSWIGEAVFYEKGGQTQPWSEHWINGSYDADVDIFKSVIDEYQSISVEVVCKVHSMTATPKILKDGILISEARIAPSKMIDQEVATIKVKLDFSDDPFKTYTCVAMEGGHQIMTKSLHVRNPFFLLSHGDCGAQLANPNFLRRKKRTPLNVGHRVSMGHEQMYPGEVPWQALLWSNFVVPQSNQTLGGYCGGTVISPHHILTAAHCVKTESSNIGHNLHPEEIVVKLGHTSQPHDTRGQDYKVKRIYVHPQYKITSTNELYNDIAIITLQTRIAISELVNPVCLPEHQLLNLITSEDKLTLSGFGLYINPNTHQWERPTFLQITNEIRKLPVQDCIAHQHENTEGLFCAGNGQAFGEVNNFTPDSCQGDSGGPLTYQDPHTGRFKLVGLVSWGSLQCGTTRGSIYVNVTHYIDWIQSTKLMDAVDDFNQLGQLPYDKMDNAIFHEMFKYMGEKRKLDNY